MHDQNCIFCKIIAGQIPGKVILETELSLVVQDIAPQAPIHYLILPKQHIVDVAELATADSQIILDLMKIPARLAANLGSDSSFKLLTNNGYAAGQRVFHLHFHFMAGN